MTPPRANTGMRIVVTGSRDWTDTETIRIWLLWFYVHHGPLEVAHGAARGADTIADRVCRGEWDNFLGGIYVKPFPVNTSIDGPWPAAGHRRNYRMLEAFKPTLVLAFKTKLISRGTNGCRDGAEERGVPTITVRPGARPWPCSCAWCKAQLVDHVPPRADGAELESE